MKKFLRVAGGVGLVLLGIAGCILPIMPGLIFLVPGLMILAKDFPWLDRRLTPIIEKFKEKLNREPKRNEKVKPDASNSAL